MTHNVSDPMRAALEARHDLTNHEQMLDAQRGCCPCKLCGGKAVISDAGAGSGYFIACENGLTFRKSDGCMLAERRLGGWAYNVMDWWNRLHSAALATPTDPWRSDIENAPIGTRTVLCWDDCPGLPAHWETGWRKGNGVWVNTYGKPFSGAPTHWMLPASPVASVAVGEGGAA